MYTSPLAKHCSLGFGFPLAPLPLSFSPKAPPLGSCPKYPAPPPPLPRLRPPHTLLAAGADDVREGLSLRQVQPPIQERPLAAAGPCPGNPPRGREMRDPCEPASERARIGRPAIPRPNPGLPIPGGDSPDNFTCKNGACEITGSVHTSKFEKMHQTCILRNESQKFLGSKNSNPAI